MAQTSMRTTWDALAAAHDFYAGDPGRARQELDDLFGRLGADPRGGTCVEVGCGAGRMTVHLADRFARVVAVDVSPAMLEQARAAVAATGRDNVAFQLVSGERLEGVGDGVTDVVVCYLVLQHAPERRLVVGLLAEFARVLASGGEAFVQLPVLDSGFRARAWRALSALAVPALARLSRDPARQAAFRGTRLTEEELQEALGHARLHVLTRQDGPEAPYRFSREVFLRLRRA